MDLKHLSGMTEIGGFNVIVMDKLREKYPEKFNESGSMDYPWFEKNIRPTNFIYVREDVNSIAFTTQKGAVKENGVNGCALDCLFITGLKLLQANIDENPSVSKKKAYECFEEGLKLLNK